MNIFKKIILILSLFCATAPVYGMDSNDGNQGFFGSLWNSAKEHPVAIATGAALCAAAGIVAYRLRSSNQSLAAQENNPRLASRDHSRIADLNKQLFNAVVDFEINDVQRLLLEGADINAHYEGYTPLYIACMNESIELVTVLLESGADIEAKAGRFQDQPLMIAARGNNTACVKLLLDAGANVETKSNIDWTTPLHCAASTGNVEVLKLFLDAGALLDTNAENVRQVEPLNVEVVKELLLEDGTLSAGNIRQVTPLDVAVCKGHVAAVRTLLQYIPKNTMKKNRSQSQQRIVAALCAFNKLRPALPHDLKKRILSYLPEDLISQEHANMLYAYTTNMREFVTYCPFTCLLELYKHLPSDQKEQCVEKIACALADNRLSKIQEWLKDKDILKFDAAQIDPEIIALLDPTTIEQHRAVIIKNVRAAFSKAQSGVQGSASNNNSNSPSYI